MFIPVYQGQKFSFSYEVGTGHYLLFTNDHKAHKYLQGDDARIFRAEIERIDNLPPPQSNDPIVAANKVKKQTAKCRLQKETISRLTENAIDIYL